IFGFVPLLPYIFLKQAGSLFFLSVLFTGIALTLLGLLRYQVTKINIVRSLGEVIGLGGAAATVAYIVGTFFRM
ncbi:VIT1/CCC1 transporter family protein, partial [Candidatus Roizmanbacteria bacterium]|nr:VIT1/CCC1 transporter family protein [Candidatus Roizmanbacteria bacterium]